MMIRIRDIASSTVGTEVSTALIDSQYLSRYREFQFRAALHEIAERELSKNIGGECVALQPV
jgi:hypothetical protein